MPISFQLSPSEDGVRNAAASFASTILKDARKTYMKFDNQEGRFQSTRPMYRKAVEMGLIKGQLPAPLGGTGGSLVETAILVEEMYAVEPSASLTIFSTALGLMPLILTAKPEYQGFLEPFLSGEGEPLASLVFTEPGGVANYLENGAPGLNTTAKEEGDEWVINGEKVS
jgi:alkylation response protein AidB-like acyl-CoA dehydrogenase